MREFVKPELLVFAYSAEDIITTSVVDPGENGTEKG